jgi:hypothetical protein
VRVRMAAVGSRKAMAAAVMVVIPHPPPLHPLLPLLPLRPPLHRLHPGLRLSVLEAPHHLSHNNSHNNSHSHRLYAHQRQRQ